MKRLKRFGALLASVVWQTFTVVLFFLGWALLPAAAHKLGYSLWWGVGTWAVAIALLIIWHESEDA